MNAISAEELFSKGHYRKTEELFRRRALSGEPEAWLFVAHCHGLLGNDRGEQNAVIALEQAAKSGDSQAAFAMHLYLRSSGDHSNDSVCRSRSFLRAAAESGNTAAQVQLADDYRSGRESGAENFSKFAYWMERASRSGSAAATRGLFEELSRRELRVPEWLTSAVELLPDDERPAPPSDA